MHTGAAQFAAQRFAEGVRERLGGGVGGVVGNRRIARRRTGNQDAAGLALDHARQHRQRKVVHRYGIQLHLSLFARRVEVGDRAERRGARVGAQDRDGPRGQFVAQLGAFVRVGEIGGPHFHGDAILVGQPGGEVD